jgi:GTP-binding protein
MNDIEPLFEMLIKHVKPFENKDNEPLQLQISALGYDDYIGRLGIGRISKGTVHPGDLVSIARRDGTISKAKISKVFVNVGLKRTEATEVGSGDIVIISGISDISIGETIGREDFVDPLPMIEIEEPTLQYEFLR